MTRLWSRAAWFQRCARTPPPEPVLDARVEGAHGGKLHTPLHRQDSGGRGALPPNLHGAAIGSPPRPCRLVASRAQRHRPCPLSSDATAGFPSLRWASSRPSVRSSGRCGSWATWAGGWFLAVSGLCSIPGARSCGGGCTRSRRALATRGRASSGAYESLSGHSSASVRGLQRRPGGAPELEAGPFFICPRVWGRH